MANIKSQKKRNLTNARRHERNKAVKSELKTRVKTAQQSAERGTDDAGEALRMAQRRFDKAASKGVIHKNQAARRKSRLMKAAAVHVAEASTEQSE
jgi:small subunit ribosomal protein S20